MALAASFGYQGPVSERARCPAHEKAELLSAVCGAEDRYFGLGGSYNYSACSECGAWVLDPRPPDDVIEAACRAYYPPSLLRHLTARAERGRPVGISGRIRARGAARQLRRLGAKFSGEKQLLDVGSGLGAFLRGMRDLTGVRVRGVDSTPETRRFAAEVHNLDVDVGELEAQQYADASFDFVSAWHLIEHVRDPATTLAEIHRITKPGGWVIIETPTLGTIAELFRSRWVQLQPPAHLHHFRPGTLLALMHRAGFEVLSVRRPWLPGEFAGSLAMRLGLRGFVSKLLSPERRAGWVGVFALTLLADLPLTFFFALTRSTGLIRVYARRPELSLPEPPHPRVPTNTHAGKPGHPRVLPAATAPDGSLVSSPESPRHEQLSEL